MELTILSPLQEQKFSVTWLEINTAVGNFVIQPGHVPMVVTLTPHQKLTFGLKNGKRESLSVVEGVAHITRGDATVILNEQL